MNLRLTELRAENFRCFPQLACELADGSTLFVGDNAQGKTSILEAACVLLRLQSPRTATLTDLIRFGAPGFGLSGDLLTSPAEPTTRLQFLFRDGKRHLSAGGEAGLGPVSYLSRSGLIVWMSNHDLALVRGGSDGRRRYLDFLGSQTSPDYRPTLLAYDKALRSRNRLLKENRTDPNELAAYTRPLLDHGTKLTSLRRELVAQVAPWTTQAHFHVSERDETITLTYTPGAGDHFESSLLSSADEESRRAVTVVGPHRDDIEIHLDAHHASSFASEGQQRTIALALKLAQARLLESLHHRPPILLIDDVFGDLDPHRRHALLRSLPPSAQSLIATTHLDWLDHTFHPARTYRVAAAHLLRE